MNNLIIYIAEKIDKITAENQRKLEPINELNKNIETLKNFINDINLIKDKIDELTALVQIDYNDCGLILELIANGDYDIFANQPQVIESKNKLTDRIKESISKEENELENYRDIKINTEDIDKYNSLINLIKTYNSNTYIEEKDLVLLKEIILELLSSEAIEEDDVDEITKFTMNILLNNSRIELLRSIRIEETAEVTPINAEVAEETTTEAAPEVAEEVQTSEAAPTEVTPINVEVVEEEPLSATEVEDMARGRELINYSETNEQEESQEKKKYLQKFKEFLNDEDYKEKDEDLYNKACIIIKNAIEMIEKEDNIDYAFIENDIEESYINSLGGAYLHIATANYIIDAYLEADSKHVTQIIDSYKKAGELDIKDFFKLEGYPEYAEIINKVEKLVSGKSFKESFEDFSIEDILKVISNNDSQADYTYLLTAVLKGIDLIAEDRKINDEELTELSNLLGYANKIIKDNKEDKGVGGQKDDEILDYFRSNFSDFKNYIVFYDPEEFIKSLKDAVTDQAGHKYEMVTTTLDKIDKIISKDIGDLISEQTSHNVHIKQNKPNPYEILAYRKGVSRVIFKVIENSGIIDPKTGKQHRVIMLLHTFYGDTDTDTKGDAENESIKLFESTMSSRYGYVKKYRSSRPEETSEDGLYQIFSQGANEAGLTDRARNELETTRDVITEIKKLQIELEQANDEETNKKGGKKNAKK